MDNNWLAYGGAYWVIGISWIGFAIVHYITAHRLGKATRLEHDGCLLGILNILLTFLGGGIGLMVLKYPYFLISSLAGAAFLPATATFLWIRRTARH